MSLKSMTGALLVTAACMLVGAQGAYAQEPCDNVCGLGVSCDTECTVANPEPGWTPTCGSAGYPCGCASNWYETGRTQLGRFQKEWVLYCEIWEVYTIHEEDGCGNSRDRCDDLYTGDHSFGTNDCCVDHGCWGRQYGC